MKSRRRGPGPEDPISPEARASLRASIGALAQTARFLGDDAVAESAQVLLDVLNSPAPVTRRTVVTLSMDLDERVAEFFAAGQRELGGAVGEQLGRSAQIARRDAEEKRELLRRSRRGSS